jgi:hypothetical protein
MILLGEFLAKVAEIYLLPSSCVSVCQPTSKNLRPIEKIVMKFDVGTG